MHAFWTCSRRIVRDRWRLTAAVFFAFLSAVGLGVGLVSLGPMMRLILHPDEGQSLVVLAQEHNATDPLLAVPEGLITHLPGDRLGGVVLLVGGIAILTILGALANFLHLYLSQSIVVRTIAEIRENVFDRVIRLPLGRIIQRGPTDYVARIIRDATELQVGLTALVSRSLAQVTKGFAAFLAACVFEFRLVLVAVVVAPVLAIVLRMVGSRVRRSTHGSLAAQQELLSLSSEALQGARVVKVNTAEDRMLARFSKSNQILIRHELRVRFMRAVAGPVVEMIAIFVLGTLAIVAAKQIIGGSMTFDHFILSLTALAVAGASFRPLAGLSTEIHAAGAPASRLVELLDEPLEQGTVSKPPIARHAQSIELDGVTYAYPDTSEPALSSVDIRIEHGERVAIVGPNGSGKTTLVSMVPRLMVPDEGRVLVDGRDLEDVDMASLRNQVGVVTQETVLFHDTIAQNIAWGLDDADHDRIVAAAVAARADEFIGRLPGGYETVLAEQGATLSGGQRQRVALARAILRDPAILILDEATSQVDPESEALINEALAEFCQGRTTIVVAHRLSTVRSADRIIVMDEGRIVQDGHHDALLASCPLYERLARTQLAGDGASTPPGVGVIP